MEQQHVIFRHEGAVGRMTLNRPKALNALTESMCEAMLDHLRQWATDAAIRTVVIDAVPGRAFCAGGDVRAIYDAGRRGDGSEMSFFRTEYRMNQAIHRFPKPYVSLIDGITMGGGCGVSINGAYRVASENAVFAMPETAIGLFPDIGASYFLNRLPGQLGMYLALTSVRIGAGDAIYSGLATHHVPASKQSTVLSRLSNGEAADVVLNQVAGSPNGAGELAQHRAAIDHAFSGASVEQIVERLEHDGEWGKATAALLRSRSPTSLKVTFRQMCEGASLDFESCQRMEFRIMARMMKGQDFYEGVRAALIDKEQAPRWQPAKLNEVSESDVGRYFVPLDDGELTL
jgi:enoyl-CoA hydratase